jgi:GTP cyclohydrolase II
MPSLTPSISDSISLPTEFGNLEIRHVQAGSKEGLVVTGSCGVLPNPLPVRIQSSCLFSESFLATNCDCAAQLHKSLEMISSGGVLVYLYEEGRGAGLKTKLEAIRLMEQEGCDTAQAYQRLGLKPDLRDYEVAASIILQSAGPDREITLITNNPNKVLALRAHGVNVISRMPLVCLVNESVEQYLNEKSRVLGHKLDHD